MTLHLIRGHLLQGLQPRQFAFVVALGGTVGSMPLPWGTCLLCLSFAALLRLNQALVQLANYLVYPLQILLFLPFFRGAQYVFGGDGRSADLTDLAALACSYPAGLLEALWQVNRQARIMIFRSGRQRQEWEQAF